MRAAEEHSISLILSDGRHLTSERVWDAEQVTGRYSSCCNSLLIKGNRSVSFLPPEALEDLPSAPQKQVLNGIRLTDIGHL